MKALERKLLRDLARLRGQALSIGLVVACGVAIYVAAVSTHDSLSENRRAYYARLRFADVFASLTRAPEPLEARLASVPGVAAVETRIVDDVTLVVEGAHEPAVGRFVSLPPEGAPGLNGVSLRQGRLPAPDSADEVVVAEPFATAHRLVPGDALTALLNGRRQRLRVVGVGMSPEFIAAMRPGAVLPDDVHFGVLWMERDALAAALDLRGSFNDVAVALAPGASQPEVLERLDALLAPYGGRGAYGRDEHPSDRFVSDELVELRTEATFLPAIFLGVAAFLLDVVVGRLVRTERTRIGTLKALGYGNTRLALHYLEWVGATTGAGVLAGIALGAWLGREWADMYAGFFRFPRTLYRLQPWIPLSAAAVGLAAAALGALSSVRRAARLPPADAMRPESPPAFRPSALERAAIRRLRSAQARMVVRGVARRPGRAALSVLGVAAATGIVLAGVFWRDALDQMVELQFSAVQREDATVTFNEPVSERAGRELLQLPGVRAVEGVRAVPIVLRAGSRSRRLELLGLPPGSTLHPLLDARLRRVPLPPDGVLLSERLATRLGARAGDVLRVEVLEGSRRERPVVVAGVVDEPMGFTAYMDRSALHRLLGEGPALNVALLTVDPRHEQALYARLEELPAVAGVTLKRAVLDSLHETFFRVLLVFSGILTAFGCVIVVGVVYNGARLLLEEKERELASLRVLGFTRREISAVLLGELGLVLAAGIPLGLAFGFGLAAFALTVMGPETLRIPLAVAPGTFAFTAGVVAVAGGASALLVRRRLDRLDLVAVLKTRE